MKNISRIRLYLNPESIKILFHAYIISLLDFANSLLYEINSGHIYRLQIVQNADARLILGASQYDHATPLFRTLHLLPVEKRILFKVYVTVKNCLNDIAPAYLSEIINLYCPERCLRSAEQSQLVCHKSKRLVIEHSPIMLTYYDLQY